MDSTNYRGAEAIAEAADAAEVEQDPPAEEETVEEEKCDLTLALALRCIQVANFGSPQTREEIAEFGCDLSYAGIFAAAISMKFPEFVDSLAICADLAYNDQTFGDKFGKLMKKLA